MDEDYILAFRKRYEAGEFNEKRPTEPDPKDFLGNYWERNDTYAYPVALLKIPTSDLPAHLRTLSIRLADYLAAYTKWQEDSRTPVKLNVPAFSAGLVKATENKIDKLRRKVGKDTTTIGEVKMLKRAVEALLKQGLAYSTIIDVVASMASHA